MKKSTLLMIVSVVLAMTLSLGGTLAYLSDVDSDVNVMTLGSVYIEQYEHERTDKKTAELEDNLEEFQKNHPHPLFPAIGDLATKATKWTDGTELNIWTNNNVVDKFVTVENTGKSGAYVRTIFAVEYAADAVAPKLNWNTSEWTEAQEIGTMAIENGESALYKVYEVYYKGILAAKDITAPSLMQVALPMNANNGDINAYGDQFDIIVLSQAVQTEGFDSAEAALNEAFGTDPSAWFNDVKYPEDEAAGAADDLMAILANAKKGAPLYITLTGNVVYTTAGAGNVQDITPASSVVIDGQGKYTITFEGAGVSPVGDETAPLTLSNMTVVDKTESYEESSWELGYLEMGGAGLTCIDVDFKNPIQVDGVKAEFDNCTFTGNVSEYGAWVYNGNATFTNCSFVGDRGLKICDMYSGAEVSSVVVDKCTFNGLTKKPGVAIDNYEGTEERKRSNEGMSVVIKNSTFINCQAGEQGNYIYETDNVVPTLENNNVVTDSLMTALTANIPEINVTLTKDAALQLGNPIKLGGEKTEKIIINGGNNTLNLNTSYVSSLGTVNPNATIILKDMTLTSSQPSGTWDSYDVIFQCNVEMNNVILEKALALEADAKLNKVTINETHDYYALWISAAGQNVEIDGLTIKSAGRGIKIDDQYVDAPAKVTLKVTDAKFNTKSKAAIMVKSAGGADITLSEVDITGVADDHFNAVWVDEDASASYNFVNVTGGNKKIEGQ